VTPAETVLDPGPIPYALIGLYGDPDLEHALREEGLDPQATTYRLIEIPLSAINDTASMPRPRMGTAYVNRTHAHWVLGTARIRAYDLLTSRILPA
jgi:hypothetical protein